MEFKDLVTQYFQRSDAMQTFWGFYITVSFALIAFFGNARRTKTLAAILTLAFVGVAIINMRGMTIVAKQRVAISQLLMHANKPDASEFFKTLPPPKVVAAYLSVTKAPRVWGMQLTHLICDIIVLSSIWVLTLHRRIAPKDDD